MSTAIVVDPTHLQPPPAGLPSESSIMPYDLTTDVFSQMVETGLIPQDRRVFLFNGRLYEKMARTRAHGSIGASVNRAIVRRLPEQWSFWPESTIVLDARNAPLPDFTVVRSGDLLGRVDVERYPGPADVGLLVQVAVTSLRQDLTEALEQYARALIPVYWVVDVPGRRILVHTQPRVVEGRGTYALVEIYQAGQSVPLVLDGQEVARIPFDELLR